MAQLRQDYDQFVARDTEVIAVGPDSQEAFVDFWQENEIPFIGLADPEHRVARQYEQEVNLLKLGRMPAQMVIDKQGIVQFVHYASSMADLPEDDLIFEKIDALNH